MPRLVICSCDLHWHWINWTLIYDTMEVSMLRLAWLTTAQHVFQPALRGRLELILRKSVSPANREQRLSLWADFAKNCLLRIGSKELPRFREKYRTLGRQKWGTSCDNDISNSVIYMTTMYREYTVYGFNNFFVAIFSFFFFSIITIY